MGLFQKVLKSVFSHGSGRFFFNNNDHILFSQSLEGAVRDLAGARGGRPLMVYTGTLLGVLRIPKGNGAIGEMFLDPKGQRLPVPAVMWKVTRHGIPTNLTNIISYTCYGIF